MATVTNETSEELHYFHCCNFQSSSSLFAFLNFHLLLRASITAQVRREKAQISCLSALDSAIYMGRKNIQSQSNYSLDTILKSLNWIGLKYNSGQKITTFLKGRLYSKAQWAIHTMRPGYLSSCLAPTQLACPTCPWRKGLLQIPPAKEFWLLRSRRRAFSAVAPTLWNIPSSEVRSAPTLLIFQKSLKTWICWLIKALYAG